MKKDMRKNNNIRNKAYYCTVNKKSRIEKMRLQITPVLVCELMKIL